MRLWPIILGSLSFLYSIYTFPFLASEAPYPLNKWDIDNDVICTCTICK